MASSSTGRPWQALRTPLMILVRLNGSVTPLRLTTARTASSTVVNRLPYSGHERRRRISWPSSASRESTTRESACRQYGQRTAKLPPEPAMSISRHAETQRHALDKRCGAGGRRVDNRGGKPQPVDDLHPCNY